MSVAITSTRASKRWRGSRTATAHHARADLKSHTDTTKPGDADRSFRDVATFLGGPSPILRSSSRTIPRDEGTIRFNHQAHMNPKGLAARRNARTQEPPLHRLPPDRRRRPVHEAHQLPDALPGLPPLNVRISGSITELAAKEEADRFRQRTGRTRTDLATAPRPCVRSSAIASSGSPDSSPPCNTSVLSPLGPTRCQADRNRPRFRLRTATATETGPVARPAPRWAEQQPSEAVGFLFEGAGGCRYCRRVAAEPSPETDQLPRFELPQIKSRWFPHSVFSHERHRSLDLPPVPRSIRGEPPDQ